MKVKQHIMDEIVWTVMTEGTGDYRGWRIGITHNVQERFEEWRRPARFKYWSAGALRHAQAIETYFIHYKGMQGGAGGDLDPSREAYVYIF